jgi:hypothetical protein
MGDVGGWGQGDVGLETSAEEGRCAGIKRERAGVEREERESSGRLPETMVQAC